MLNKIIGVKEFLLWGGIVLILVAILGFAGVIGPNAESSIFGAFWVFDNFENVAHLVLGVVAVFAAFKLSPGLQKPLVIVVGIFALFAAVWSLFIGENFLGAGLQNPADTALHILVGVWALWSAFRSAPAPEAPIV